MSWVYCAPGDLIPGASVRRIACAKALARTGLPSLKRNPLRMRNVQVRRSGEAAGSAAATSGTTRRPSGAGLSGFPINRAHVVSRSAHPERSYDSAGSSEATEVAGNAILNVPPFRTSVLAGPRPAAEPIAAPPRTRTANAS